jgi:hypothetical protein
LFALKGRQVGATTLGCAYDAHHIRFSTPNARAHLFSRREDEAVELLEQVTFGLDNLPEWLQLPTIRSTTRIREYSAGAGDRRTLRAFPADRSTGRGQTCTHAHVDEWSAMAWPAKTLASISPSVADRIGSCHLLTTECVGPESESATYWRQCEADEGKHTPVFISSTARPDRDEAWLEAQRRSMSTADFNREYPTSAAQALEAAGERMFSSEDLDTCGIDALGCFPSAAEYESRYAQFFRNKPRKYSGGVDIGFKADASVIVLLDVTEELNDVVYFRRLLQPSVDELQRAVEEVHRLFPRAHLIWEDTGIGGPIRQGVNVPESKLHGYNTSPSSKSRALGELAYLIERHHLRYDPQACEQLDRELRAYRLPDTALKTDCVMALSFAVAGTPNALNPTGGRILSVARF